MITLTASMLACIAAASMESPVQPAGGAFVLRSGPLALELDRTTGEVIGAGLGGTPAAVQARPLAHIEEVEMEGPARQLTPEDFAWPAEAIEEEGPGDTWMRVEGEREDRPSFAVELQQEEPRPIILEGSCRARFNIEACGWYSHRLALKLRASTVEGEELPLESAYFGQYDHGPQRNRVVMCPERPVERATIELSAPGGDVTAWYRDVSIREGRYLHTPWTGAAEQIDTAVHIPLDDEPAGLSGLLTVLGRPDCVVVEGRVRSMRGEDRALSVTVELPLDAIGGRWHDDVRTAREIEPGRLYRDALWYGAGRDGYSSRYPFACVETAEGQAIAIAVPPGEPRVVQFDYDAAAGLLRARFDLGLSPDAGQWANRAGFSVYLYPVDPAWGFRDAAAKYQELFPWAFKRRAKRIGTWLAFMTPREIAGGWEDFGFQYLESTSDMAWAETQGLDSLKYAEPWIHHHEFPPGVEAPEVHGAPVPEGSLAVADRIANWKGPKLPLDMRRRYPAFEACATHDAFGQLQGYYFRSEGGRNENMMIVNPNPRLPSGDGAMALGAWDMRRLEEAWQTRRQIILEGWAAARTAAHPFLGLDRSRPFAGAQSLVIAPIEGKSYFEQYLFGIVQAVRAGGGAGDALALRYAARADGAPGGETGYAWHVEFHHPDGDVTTVTLPLADVGEAWRTFEAEAVPPKAYMAVRLSLSHSSSPARRMPTLYLDGVRLERGGVNLLVNGGFEKGRVAPCRLDGVYLDTMECYEANFNYRRAHWALTPFPLTFDSARRPTIHQIFSHIGFARLAAEWAWPRDMLVMANATPRTPFGAPWLDVLGTEFNWKHGGHWTPWSDKDFNFARAMAGPKPYCSLQYGDLTAGEQEKYLARCLFYGVLPTNQAAPDGSWYWRRAAAVERHRPIFAKYVPHIIAVAEAGWQPVTDARADTPDLWLERFGQGGVRYLTAFNPTSQPIEAIVKFEDGLAPAEAAMTQVLGSAAEALDGYRYSIELSGEEVALFRIDAPAEAE